MNLHEILFIGGIGIDSLKGQIRIPQDCLKHVVEIVGHAARQPAHRLQFLGLEQLPLEILFFFLDFPTLVLGER